MGEFVEGDDIVGDPCTVEDGVIPPNQTPEFSASMFVITQRLLYLAGGDVSVIYLMSCSLI